ncbi:MAG: hypothetical protein ACP5T0_04485 [Verrucomicrobiia bacterium]
MDGLAAIKAIRKYLPDVPVIITTGFKPESLNVDEKEDKILAFLNKPYRLDELLAAVAAALNITVEA